MTTTESQPDVFGDLDVNYLAPRGTTVEYVRSADGTAIAYERSGDGPPLIIVGGGLNDRAMFSPFASLLSGVATVYNYDRRGRGDSGSGDLDTWTIEREIEDLRAVMGAAGEPCAVFANCTGGIVAIHAAAAGVPMRRLALYEPPYGSLQATPEVMATIRRLIGEDRREEVVTIFCRDIVGLVTDETIDRFRSHPAWAAFHTMVPSTYCDGMIDLRHGRLPIEELRTIAVPTLVMRGDTGDAGIHAACDRIAQEIPGAEIVVREGFDHLFDQKAWAQLVADHVRV